MSDQNQNGQFPTANTYPDLPPIAATDLDPTTWAEVKEEIPVVVVASKLRYSDPKYRSEDKTFADGGLRPKLPRPIKQWDLRLERLDANIRLLDGQIVPATMYGGFDLEKFNKNRSGQYEIQSITRGRTAEMVLIEAWQKISGGPVVPPERLEGMKFMVERYREKDLTGRGFFKANVVIPIAVLDPSYEFAGTKQVFEQKRQDNVDEAATVGASAFAGATSVSPAQAAQDIATFLETNGVTVTGPETLGHPDFPKTAMFDPFVTAVASGRAELDAVLEQYGVAVEA